MTSNDVQDQVVVAAAPAGVRAVIEDVEAYPHWQDEVREVEVLETDEDARPARVRFVVDAMITTTTYVLDYTHEVDAVRWRLVSSDQLERLEGAYELTGLPDGSTRVTYTLAVHPRFPVPGLLRRQAARRIADSALRGLKGRVEASPPPGTESSSRS